MATKIQWADEVWNPVTGCSPVSDGCKNCYARRMAQRLKGRYGYPADDPFRVTFHWNRRGRPKKWLKPKRIFVCSMGDLFHEDVEPEHIDEIFEVMTRCAPQHTYMILTKRPERIPTGKWSRDWKNIWLGVSVENQDTADERIPALLEIPAAVRFVSYEPALGPVDFDRVLVPYIVPWSDDLHPIKTNVLTGKMTSDDGPPLMKHINWIIAGCESGSGRRQADIDWFRSVRDQCLAAAMPFFLKQMDIDGKIAHMPELDGRVWDQVPRL